MPWSIDDKFRIPGNEEIVAFIARNPALSAHSDVADLLTRSAEGLKSVGRYCPDLHAYAYFVLYTLDRRIFAIACGMSLLAYRLPAGRRAEATAAGGVPCHAIGEEWVDFGDRSFGGSVDLRHWCRVAYEHAVSSERHA